MIEQIFTDITRVINQCFLWCIQINDEIPFLTIFLGVFLIYQLCRFFIYPMFKSGSDSVTNKNDDKKKIKIDSDNKWTQLGKIDYNKEFH